MRSCFVGSACNVGHSFVVYSVFVNVHVYGLAHVAMQECNIYSDCTAWHWVNGTAYNIGYSFVMMFLYLPAS